MNFNDCYCEFTPHSFIIGNSQIERRIILDKNVPFADYIKRKDTNYSWSTDNKQVICNVGDFDFECCKVEYSEELDDKYTNTRLKASLLFYNDKQQLMLTFWVFPTTPFVSMQISLGGEWENKALNCSSDVSFDGIEDKAEEYVCDVHPKSGTIDVIGVPEQHLKLTSVSLRDVTDKNNTLVSENTVLLYSRVPDVKSGQMFLLDAYLSQECIMIVKEAPSENGRWLKEESDFEIFPGQSALVTGTGWQPELQNESDMVPLYYSTVGVGTKDQLTEEYKHYYRMMCRYTENAVVMSNTWGDRSRDSAISEQFLKNEIRIAKEIGVRVLQIDDGWQEGITKNSALKKGGAWSGGYYDTNPEFWTPNKQKFPDGFNAVCKFADQNDIELGLWFSPDQANDYENWEKDAVTVLGLWKTYGIKYFKIDGVNVTNKLIDIRLSKFVKKVTDESSGEIVFQFDITAQKRWGYLYGKEYGKIFVENRYTDWANYYPHLTLRNVWHLSKYIPLSKLQFELLNIRRNKERYTDNFLKPACYSMDYVFAVTMFSNPLFWMELSNLTDEDKNCLKNILKVYYRYSDDIGKCIVSPIGMEPDGIAFTGLVARKNKSEAYALLFRENTELTEYCFPLNVKHFEVLYKSNDDIHLEVNNNGVSFESPIKRSFAFIRLLF